MKKILVLVSALFLIAAACNKQTVVQPDQNQNTQNDSQNQSQVYENQYMKLNIPEGWTAKAVSSNQAAVNITKGNYILYINTQASQASGVEGGRFAEIAQGAPSADAVVTVQPSPPCGTSESTEFKMIDATRSRFDLYVSNSDKTQYCAKPTNGSVWYFSYVAGTSTSYFNYYGIGAKALVITMSYNSKNVNTFPAKGSAELNSKLSEMTSIVQSLEVKQK